MKLSYKLTGRGWACAVVSQEEHQLEIKAISYQGAVTRFSVETEKLRICAEVPAEGTSFKEGDKVRLIWPKAAMVTMEDGA